jgi:predicted transcriptional regulator YdeE
MYGGEPVEPKIGRKETFALLGLQEHFTQETEDFEGIWKRFMRYEAQIGPHSVDGAFYGANYAPRSGTGMDYLAGMAVGEVESVPEGLTLREVPGSRYAVFECTVKTISDTYDWILTNGSRRRPIPVPVRTRPKPTLSATHLLRIRGIRLCCSTSRWKIPTKSKSMRKRGTQERG